MTNRFRFLTAGESHGRLLSVIVEGVPSGLPITVEDINAELRRRQLGYGRSVRQKNPDEAQIISGVRFGKTMGGPIAMLIENKFSETEQAKWAKAMQVEPLDEALSPEALQAFHLPRPGHADLAGAVKYDHFDDLRNVLERASARETAARVAAAAIAKRLLCEFGIEIASHVVEIGHIKAAPPDNLSINEIRQRAEASPLRCLDAEAEAKMIELIEAAGKEGDTLGGVFEVIAENVPIGLGSYVHWDRKLDGRLLQAIGSIHAVKGAEIGLGFEGSRRRGSQVHDPFIGVDVNAPNARCFLRASNNAGGLEGGVTNGERVVVRGAMKPLSTLRKPLQSVNVKTKELQEAHAERSDVCSVPAAAVVGEAMVAIVLADVMLEKFGGDSISEMKRNFESYCEHVRRLAADLS